MPPLNLDTYSHVTPELQQAAADSFDRLLNVNGENELVEEYH